MPRFGLVGPTYQAQSVNADAQRCVNFVLEPDQSGAGRSDLAMYQRPGLRAFAQLASQGAGYLATGATRGEIVQNGRMFAVANYLLYEVFADGSTNYLTHLLYPNSSAPVNLDSNPVSFALSANQLAVCSGGYVMVYQFTPTSIVHYSSPGLGVGLDPTGNWVPNTEYIIRLAQYDGAMSLIGLADDDVILLGPPQPDGYWIDLLLPNHETCTWRVYVSSDGGATWHYDEFAGPVNVPYVDQHLMYHVPTIAGVPPNNSVFGSTNWAHENGDPSTPITGIAQIEFLDSYFLGLKQNSNIFRYSQLNDALNWDALDVNQLSITADNVRAFQVDHRELFLFGYVDTAVYSNTGDPDNPFQPNPSGFIQQGIAAPLSRSQLDNTMFWIGGDVRGAGMAWRANGYTPQRVSNYAIETEWQSYSTIADAVGFPMQTNGHSLWVVYFPTANKTWVYDVANGNWLEWTHLLPDTGSEEAFRGWNHVYAFGKHLVGDWKTGNVYEMAWPVSDGSGGWNFVTDELTIGTKDLIRRWRRAPHIANEGERIYIPELQIFLESGLGPIPPLGVAPIDAPTVGLLNVPGGVAAGTYSIILANYDASGNLTEVSDQSNTTILAPRVLQIGVPAGTLWYVYVSTDGGVTWVYSTQNGAGTFSLSAVALAAMTAGTPPTAGYRAPQLMLRISKDGGHTWGNELVRDCGQAGDFAKRVRYLRLGQARDWVFEIAMTDPVPLRITDAVIPDYPSSRIVTNLRKQA